MEDAGALPFVDTVDSQNVSTRDSSASPASVLGDENLDEDEVDYVDHLRKVVGGGKRGPQPNVPMDEERFRQLCVLDGTDRWTNLQLSQEFNCSLDRVKNVKRRLKLTRTRAPQQLPDFQWLQNRWVDDKREDPLHRKSVAQGVMVLASELHVKSWSLRLHMKTEGFDPVNPWTDAQVQARIREQMNSAWCSKVGVTFAETILRRKFGMVVRRSQLRRALAILDPEGVRQRRRITKKKNDRVGYCVKGPRSLYHLDGHEKLAKAWGKH